jgi:hypothetical protein
MATFNSAGVETRTVLAVAETLIETRTATRARARRHAIRPGDVRNIVIENLQQSPVFVD